MSFITRVIIGWFDAANAMEHRRVPTPARKVTAEEVERLQAVCDELFRPELRLAGHHTGGLIWIEDLGESPEMYQAACVAHELFGMAAVDVAHGAMVYPEEEIPIPSREEELARSREHTRLRGAELERHVDEWLEFLTSMATYKRKTRERVRAYVARHGGAPPVPPSPVDT